MSSDEIVRAWKNPENRDDGFAANHPAGDITLDEVGGNATANTFTVLCCTVDAYWCPSTWGGGWCPPQSPLCMPEIQ